ncbi:MAG: alpha/beta hydrolase [Gammaproteobacteria bacterium]|nr:alpha/beta hydrolase [Gammaproteobacteria bacterium]
MSQKEFFEIDVDGGKLGVARWPGRGPKLLLVHGISASHMAWSQVVEALPADAFDVYAPDLRGRGASNALPGPYGMARHVADLCALIDGVGGGPVILAGHSMGAYIGVEFGATRPAYLDRLVLVDGGIALPLPDGVTPEASLERTLGPALARLRREFASREAYLAFWHEHPAFADAAAWNEHVEAYFAYDLEGEPPHLKSRAREAAVRADGLDLMRDEMVTMIDRVTPPMLLLTAVRGLLDQPQPLMPVAAVKAKVEAIAQLAWQEIPDTNHYSITLGNGATATARAIAMFAGGA